MKWRLSRAVGLPLLVAASAIVGATPGRSTDWDGAVSSDWFNPANWTSGVPTSSDLATVTFPGRPAIIGSPGAVASTLYVAGDDLTITAGGTLTTGHGDIGIDNATGSVTVTGAGAIWTATTIQIGANNFEFGTLTIANGGVVTSTGVTVFNNANNIINIGAGAGTTAGTLNAPFVNNGSINFNHTSPSHTFAPAITGAATVNVLLGTTTLTGTNTYTGNTNMAGGTLIVGADSNLGSASSGLTFNTGTLRFGASFSTARTMALSAGGGTIDTNGFNSTSSGIISGAGALTKTGTGTLTLTGVNTYSGGTTINGGALSVSADNHLGNAAGGLTFGGGTLQFGASFDTARTVALNAGGGTIDTNGFSTTLSGIASGAGGLTKAGSGTLTLTATNTYAGGTTINGGVLSVSADNRLGNAAGGLAFGGGTLQLGAAFNTARAVTLNAGDGTIDTNGFNSTFSGNMAGAGGLTKAGAGTLTMTGTNSYTGGTTISSGTLQVGSGGTGGSIAGGIINNAALIFNRSNNLTYDSNISGSGTLTKLGAGTLTLTGDNAVGGGTTITAGTLQIGDGTTSGSIAGNIVDNSALIFNHSDSLTFGDVVSGSGTLTKLGAGTLVLTDSNTYAGGTTITAGTLQIGDGGTGGSIVGDVVADGTLAFNHADTLGFAGVISGAGAVRQIGSGLTDLTGNSSGFTGTTTVEAGTLAVNGSLCGDVNVLSGARLQGTGTLCDATNFAGGTVAPGNSIGTITITGAYVGNGGTLEIESVLGGDSSPTDQVLLDGAGASASGSTNVQVINLGGAGAMTTGFGIPIVVAQGGATSTGGAFTLAGPVAAGPYQYLLFRGPESGGTADQQNTWYLRSHQQSSGGGGGGGPVPLYRPETSVYAALPGLARSLGITTIGTFHERNGDQGAVRGGAGRAWGRIFGEHTEQGSAGELDATFAGWLGGVQLGIDAFRFRNDYGAEDAAGFFFVLAKATGDVNGFAIGVPDAFAGSSHLNGPSFGAYYTHIGPGNWYLDGLAMVTFYNQDGVSTNNVETNVGGSGGFLSLEAGVPLTLGLGVTLEPQAQLIYQHLDFSGLTDPFSTVAFDTPDALTGRLGVRLAGVFGVGPDLWRPYLKANLWHDWVGNDKAIYAGVHELASDDEVTALEAGGGLVAQLTDGVGLWGEAAYTTDVDGSDLEVVQGNAGVKVSW